MKQFDKWNEVKKTTHNSFKNVFFKERDIFWASVGINIGYEQDGKGYVFSRPVLIFKKYNKNIFLGIPLSTKIKNGSFFYNFELNGNMSNALLVQARLYDAKRLENKIGKINIDDFEELKKKFKRLLGI